MTDIWLVGKRVGDWDEQGEWRDEKSWEVQGVFSSRERAVAACSTVKHFVGRLTLDELAPDETTPFPDFAYPQSDASREASKS